jgi:hypothetical protein
MLQTQIHPFAKKADRFSLSWNPILLLDASLGAICWRIASKTTLNCESYFFSISSSLHASLHGKQVFIATEQKLS